VKNETSLFPPIPCRGVQLATSNLAMADAAIGPRQASSTKD